MAENNRSSLGILLTATFIVVAVIVAIAFFATRGDDQPTPPTTSPNEQREEELEPEPVHSFDYIMPENWDYTERAETAIETLGEGQRIQFGIVQDPTNEAVYYFATSAYDQEEETNDISIYRYNIEDFTWQRLYRNSYQAGSFRGLDEHVLPIYHVVGYDNNGIVILIQDVNDSPHPCTEPILLGHGERADGIRSMVRMQIVEDAHGTFEPYTPPDEVINEAEEKQETCFEQTF